MSEQTSQPTRHRMTLRDFILNYNAIIILVILLIVAAIASPLFLSAQNFGTLLRQQSVYLVIAIGMLMVIITGGIDLSAAGTVAMSAVIMVVASSSWGWGTVPCILAAIVIGALIGCFNGFFVSVTHMPSFIVTLAMSYITEGIAFMITKGNTLMINTTTSTYKTLVYPGFATLAIPVINLPFMIIFSIIVIAIFYVVMRYTKFGRLVYAVGSNENAVQLAGINSRRIIFIVWLLEGILCGLGGILLTCRTGNASALTCDGDYALSTVASVVIGGASLSGGEGGVIMTVVGVFIIGIIGNIMNLIGMASYPQMIVKGAIIIFAVLLKGISSRNQS